MVNDPTALPEPKPVTERPLVELLKQLSVREVGYIFALLAAVFSAGYTLHSAIYQGHVRTLEAQLAASSRTLGKTVKQPDNILPTNIEGDAIYDTEMLGAWSCAAVCKDGYEGEPASVDAIDDTRVKLTNEWDKRNPVEAEFISQNYFQVPEWKISGEVRNGGKVIVFTNGTIWERS